MQYLWEGLNSIESAIKKAKDLYLFLDFDGTISPIVPTPSQSKLPEKTKLILNRLISLDVHIIFVSGRALIDLKDKVNIPGTIYCGIHGLEWEINGQVFRKVVPQETIAVIKEIKEKMAEIKKDFEEAVLQDKSIAVALNYRRVKPSEKCALEKILDENLAKYLKSGLVSLLSDKYTYEIRANIGWTKGDLVRFLMVNLFNNSGEAIYIGDSETDEDAFEVLNENITIKVGLPGRSRAGYFLRNEQDVYKFLQWLYTVLV